MRRIVVNVCHSCMATFATYGEVPRNWNPPARLVCSDCAGERIARLKAELRDAWRIEGGRLVRVRP